MRISFLSTMIIAGCSGVVLYLSMVLGHWLSGWLPVAVAKGMGAAILFILGLMALWQARKNVAGSLQQERDMKTQDLPSICHGCGHFG
jgi:putative Mn2+ efflux pump MntP